MAFADLKNDFVFRRIFATHPEILRGLLNDLLERSGDQAITSIPADLPAGPFREALDLANKATFTQSELDAYQKVIDEINQARELADAKWEEGHKSGLADGKRDTLLHLLARRSFELTEDERERIARCADVATLDRWFDAALTANSVTEVLSG